MNAFGVAGASCLLVAHEVVEAGVSRTLQHRLTAQCGGEFHRRRMDRKRLQGDASGAGTAAISPHS